MTDTRTTDTDTTPTTQTTSAASSVAGTLQNGTTAVQDAVTPMVDKARTFARERPYATAALVGTIALAVINTLRGKRA
ncbi:CsbD family protein [Sphingomonas qilianensis]|uniref:CsbD family protein n=1 Tax=Sphingomonas qilianensis TaxID=1736690 RepID=A0ABU9XT52_9SPHN